MTGLLERKILREEGYDLRLDAIGNVIEMIALINLKKVSDLVGRKDTVELLGGVGNAVIVVADIQGQCFQAAKIVDVLVDLFQWSICRPFVVNIFARIVLASGKGEVQRGVVWIR